MKKHTHVIFKIISIVYKITPFFLGIFCYYPFYVSNESMYPLFDAAWAAVRLYVVESEEGIAVTLPLVIARFMALTTTLSILIVLLNKLTHIADRVKLLAPKSTAVYGDSDYAGYLFESLGHWQRIRGRDKLVKGASRYILMFSGDKQNIEFYSANYDYLKDKHVYIMLDNISRQNIENSMLTVFSIAENCARQYWRDYPVEKSEKIAIIGFKNVGKNILLYGLGVNLIDPEQRFEYHIYGDGTLFRSEHTELDKMAPDEIFHDIGLWNATEMAQFDRIIICSDADGIGNIEILSRLLTTAPMKCQIYVYAPNGDIITDLFGSANITCFGTASEAASIDVILNERLMEDARKQHEYYVSLHGGVPWERLSAFSRYSNINSSDYMFVVRRLKKKGVSFEKLAELEHIRWCRYHYINNWKYGPETDKQNRVHNCLIPFSKLSWEEKLKDVEAIKAKCKTKIGNEERYMGLNKEQKKERSEYLEKNLTITECSRGDPYIFVSYASDNWETVFKTAVVPLQKQYGLRVYADKAFDNVNDKWIVPMLRNVRGADILVAFVSQSYIESYACFLELLTAVNNRKQIVFVSLEDRLHLGKTTDQPVIERGVKNEIINQGSSLSTNTNNTSNDIMRAMKSAFTSISTLLEQDALSKYDISDAFINFFRDASVNQKTVNDLIALKQTIGSLSSNVFSALLISDTIQDTESTARTAEAPTVEKVHTAIPSIEENPAYSTTTTAVQAAMQNATAANEETSVAGKSKQRKKLKVILVSAGTAVLVIAVVLITLFNTPKSVTNISYTLSNGSEGIYTGEWLHRQPHGKGIFVRADDGAVFDCEWKNGLPNGYGTVTTGAGAVYGGEWKDGKINGRGTYINPDGTVKSGIWEDGVFVCDD